MTGTRKMPPRFLQETGEVFGTGPRTCRTGGVSPARFISCLPRGCTQACTLTCMILRQIYSTPRFSTFFRENK